MEKRLLTLLLDTLKLRNLHSIVKNDAIVDAYWYDYTHSLKGLIIF
jgi:hypothetical protein